MLTADTVYNKLIEIADVGDVEKETLFPFCQSAAAVFNGKLRAGADASDIRLVMAASASAYCRYLLVKIADEGNIMSIKAGDITVSKSEREAAKSAMNMLNAALEDAGELLEDREFLFATL